MNSTLPFTIYLKDASIDGDIEQKGELEVSFKMPVIQAMSADGMNKVIYPPIQEKVSLSKSFVLISDCPVDLQLKLSIVEGDSLFYINNVQEIKKSDVNKVLLERQGVSEEHLTGKQKSKAMNKQLCRLTCGNAIRVTIAFKAPKLSEQLSCKLILGFRSRRMSTGLLQSIFNISLDSFNVLYGTLNVWVDLALGRVLLWIT